MTLSKIQLTAGLFASIAMCLAVGGIGAALTTPEIDGWYRSIAKPSWNPPDAVFGPVWTILYILMGIAAWIIWHRTGIRNALLPLTLFSIQLILNLAWSLIFFRMHAVGFAFLELIALWLLIALTMVSFFRHSLRAGFLMLPYLVWVSFAGLLNYTIWTLNR